MDPNDPIKTATPMLDAIIEWGKDNHIKDRIWRAHQQRGGWEGWVQVELAIYLGEFFKNTLFPGREIKVTREEYTYGETQQRSDILFTTIRENGTVFYNAIELKCETLNTGKAGFRLEVKNDCTKVDNAKPKESFAPCAAWVLAFSTTPDANLSDLKVGQRNLERYKNTIPIAHGLEITLWWGTRDVKESEMEDN
ncbi:hypothetical protein E1B28_013337 [Marasmius oreades]|uniref:Uncharacterized protein n=1 Tax=Marasmius oreades TaxID=181124 RepID=A0A9P7UPS8_9AGAR|nr:uncharacterized protein E1B28_013337 [Marasmius oreades]KAG7087364.1 hypothetical protein E1B28_013337 [Marasmius oreades]